MENITFVSRVWQPAIAINQFNAHRMHVRAGTKRKPGAEPRTTTKNVHSQAKGVQVLLKLCVRTGPWIRWHQPRKTKQVL